MVPVSIALLVQSGEGKPQFLLVEEDGFTIGSGERCDLRLTDAGLPKLHSILHRQGGAVWIEAADDDALVTVDGEVFRRRALRDGSRLSFGNCEVTVRIGEGAVPSRELPRNPARLDAELALLSAEELCDRIEREERLVEEFDRRRRFGWRALMSAVSEAMHGEPEAVESALADDKLDELALQVRDLSETLEQRTKALSAQEAQLIESSAQLYEAQLRVSRQLEQLLERLSRDADEPGELRVSA
jgi:hypothetical protein